MHPIDRLSYLTDLTEKHPDMPLRDAMDAAAHLPVMPNFTMTPAPGALRNMLTGCALSGIAMVGPYSPEHAAKLAVQMADATLVALAGLAEANAVLSELAK